MPQVNTIDDGRSYYTNCIEYRVTRADGVAYSWSAVNEEQVRRDWFDRGWLIQRIEVYSEWEAEQDRIWEEMRYRAEMEQASGGVKAS